DLPNLAFAHAEALGHQPSRLGHVHLVVLGVHESQENLLTAVFGKLRVVWALGHGNSFGFTQQPGGGSYPEIKAFAKLMWNGWGRERPHGKGGLGEVFVALDQELNREVALKEIQDQHTDDPHSRGRFVRARSWAPLAWRTST